MCQLTREAAVQLHLADHDGHQQFGEQNGHPLGHLPVHHDAVPVLQGEPAAMAELDSSLAQLQRLLREGAENAGPSGQGQLLDAAPGVGQHVRERLLPAPSEALQVRPECHEEASSKVSEFEIFLSEIVFRSHLSFS